MKAEAAKADETIRALEIRRQEIEASIAGPSPEQQLEAPGAGGSGARSDSAHGAATAVAVEPLLEPLAVPLVSSSSAAPWQASRKSAIPSKPVPAYSVELSEL